jgi:hypothetical protein
VRRLAVGAVAAAALAVAGPAPVATAAKPRLRLEVRPAQLDAGRQTLLRIRVTTRRAGRVLPVGGAGVTLGRRGVFTDSRGRARMTVILPRPGRPRLTASRGGFRSAALRLRVIPTRHFLDCSAAREGDGSFGRPWRSLDRANAAALRPGERLLLRRGSTCRGRLDPRSSGAQGAPILIGAYGRGPRPRIVATGPEAVLLRDRSHVIVEDLEITNPGDGSGKRRGVHLVAQRGLALSLRLRRLHVHDVGGNLDKDAEGSGGIQLSVLGDLRTPAQRFDAVVIEDNLVEDVSRSGIFIAGTSDGSRPRAAEPWPEASSRVVVRRNRLARLAGDGIVPTGTLAALVEDNVVSEGNRAGRSPADPRGFICNAGIWTFHANRTLIQRNEVFGFAYNGCDGTGYDIDYDQDATVVQFNYSHDNEGGFILLCTDEQPRTAEVRFNLSVNDHHLLQESPCLVPGGFQGTLDAIRMHNNTFLVQRADVFTSASAPIPVLGNPGTFEFRNNIVYVTQQQSSAFPCGDRCSHNLFFNLPPSGANAVVADPRFEEPGRRGAGRLQTGTAFRLRAGSPAIGAGTPVPGSVGTDYFGNPLPSGRPPAIGFHQPG